MPTEQLLRVPGFDHHAKLEAGSVEEVSSIIVDTCKRLNLVSLPKLVSWSWNSRFKVCMGDATWPRAHIRLSSALWPRASVDERRETVVHETCHLAVAHLRGHMQAGGGAHGRLWQSLMLDAGSPAAARCHRVNVDGLVARVEALCNCKIHRITPRKASKIRNGSIYICRSCGGELLVGE